MEQGKLLVENAWKIFGDRRDADVVAVQDLSLAVRDNEFVSLVGPSGCGKSTLLMMAAGLESISAGDILFDGTPVTGPGADRGMVFQSYTLFPWLSVEENIRFALKKSGLGRSEQGALVREHIQLVGLTGFERAYPNQLSGGMRQRVAIARALANDPKVVLADEPTGNLDTHAGERVLEILRGLVDTQRRAVVVVTHDLALAARADRQIRIVDGKIAI